MSWVRFLIIVDVINSLKIFRITDYFRSNPKNNPTVMTVSALFNHFSNLLVYHYTKDKSPSGYLDISNRAILPVPSAQGCIVAK
mgnify:CR=1 FL=1